MTIRIDSPEVLALIENVSTITGEDPETIVLVAVREQSDRLNAEAERRSRIYETVRDLQAMAKKHPGAIVDPGDLLYGEDGLPK